MPTSSVKWSAERLRKTQGGYEAERHWIVTDADNKFDALNNATPIDGNDPPIPPDRGEPHSDNTNLKANDIDATPLDGPRTWDVRAIYTTQAVTQGGAGGNPLLEPTLYGCVPGELTEEAEVDANGIFIMNAAYSFYENRIQKRIPFWVFVVERNEPFFNTTGLDNFVMRENTTAFTIAGRQIAPRQGMLMPPQLVGMYPAGAAYVRVRYEIVNRTDREKPFWQVRPNWGNQAQYESGKLGEIVDADRTQRFNVVLNGDGTPKDTNLKVKPATTGALVGAVATDYATGFPERKYGSNWDFLQFQIQGEADLGSLGL